jgi:hypothetical protein
MLKIFRVHVRCVQGSYTTNIDSISQAKALADASFDHYVECETGCPAKVRVIGQV